MEAYLFLREKNQSIPSDTLELMKDAALATLVDKNESIGNVMISSVHFAEWMDIVCIRDGRYDWKYKEDNYAKKYSTKEMYAVWKTLVKDES